MAFICWRRSRKRGSQCLPRVAAVAAGSGDQNTEDKRQHEEQEKMKDKQLSSVYPSLQKPDENQDKQKQAEKKQAKQKTSSPPEEEDGGGWTSSMGAMLSSLVPSLPESSPNASESPLSLFSCSAAQFTPTTTSPEGKKKEESKRRREKNKEKSKRRGDKNKEETKSRQEKNKEESNRRGERDKGGVKENKEESKRREEKNQSKEESKRRGEKDKGSVKEHRHRDKRNDDRNTSATSLSFSAEMIAVAAAEDALSSLKPKRKPTDKYEIESTITNDGSAANAIGEKNTSE